MTTITDIITYFAKFPLRNGVLNNFHTSGDPIDGYDELKAAITALPSALLPDITEYVFSTDETVLADKLRNMNGYFLLLEYGAIKGEKGMAGGRSYAISLAVTVGHPSDKKNTDIMAESLMMDKCLSLLMAIVARMEDDNFELCGNSRFMDGSLNISPAEPTLLYNNMGWVASFSKNENMM